MGSIDIRAKAHIGRDFIDEDLMEEIESCQCQKIPLEQSGKGFTQDPEERHIEEEYPLPILDEVEEDKYLYVHSLDSGYIFIIENNTDKRLEFMP